MQEGDIKDAWIIGRKRRSKAVKKNEIRIFVAGGGTGGHLFPGVAIGKEIIRRYPEAEILFITGRRKIETDILTQAGFHQSSICVEGLKGRGWKKGAITLLKLPYALIQSFGIIGRLSPCLVLGVGGYSSGPVCLAARIMGVPTAIHEQNSYPGLTNRLLCRIVDRVFISFKECKTYLSGGRVFLTGNPIREELLEDSERPDTGEKGFTILVMGGSQGARAINRAFVSALEILKGKGRSPHVIHQTGVRDFFHVEEEYKQKGLKGEVIPFIGDMAQRYGLAHLVISRAGATTVSELAALGKPSILIPYPYAAYRHQETNAKLLLDIGGAEMIPEEELSGQMLAERLKQYMDHQETLKEMGERARSAGRRDAARAIVDQLQEMMGVH